jgi:HD superfamily phosphodiesterase
MEKDIKIIESHIVRCRPGDWEHAKRVVRWVKELGEGRNDLPLLVLAGYIHDIGWRDLLNKDKITFEELLELEPKANQNSESYIRELLLQLNYNIADIETILRLVSSADKHKSVSEDEAIIVDADQLSKLDIDHIKEKYQKSEWLKMYELWKKEIGQRVKTEKAKQLYPNLLASLKETIDNNLQ